MSQPAGSSEPILTILLFLLRRWRWLAAAAVVGAVLAIIVTLIPARKYASYVSFFSLNRTSSSPAGLSSLVGNLGLGALSQDVEGPQFFADLVTSSEIIGPLVAEPIPATVPDYAGKTLSELYGGSTSNVALRDEKAMQKVTSKVLGSSVSAKTGVVHVSAVTDNAELSRWVLERVLTRLNDFNLVRRRAQAGDERKFAEELLRVREDSLALAESKLEAFVQGNREYRNSPSLKLAADRLEREVSYQLDLRTSAASMYQESRVREVRNTPALIVVERPRVAARALSRGMAVKAAGGGFLGIALAAGLLIFWRAAIIQRGRGDIEAVALTDAVESFRQRRRRAKSPGA